MNEFDIIQRFFDRPELQPPQGAVGIGDDCAVVSLPQNKRFAQSMDTLVAGVHFPENCAPDLLGYRSLAVCISDLAAMGATPHSFLLGLTLPEANEYWLQAFSDGLTSCASDYCICLIGGDTTRGPLTLSLQVQGTLPQQLALTRKGAAAGDLVYVSGCLGDAAGILPAVLDGKRPDSAESEDDAYLLKRFYRPDARIVLGQWLLDNGATAAIDLSDGLLGDLRHVLRASNVGAEIDLQSIPLSPQLVARVGETQARSFALTGGDDYELCFCLPQEQSIASADKTGCRVTCIGRITSDSSLSLNGSDTLPITEAYQHF